MLLGAQETGALGTVTAVSRLLAAAPVLQTLPLLALFTLMDACVGSMHVCVCVCVCVYVSSRAWTRV